MAAASGESRELPSERSVGGGPGPELDGQGSTSAGGAGGNVGGVDDDGALQITCFTEEVHDVALHFQIIRLHKQVNRHHRSTRRWSQPRRRPEGRSESIYVWIGCNSAKFGHLYAAATTRPSNMVSVTSLLGGGSDNVGSSIARRLVLKTGLNIVLACNIPKDSPMIEANAERKLVEKLRSLGYIQPKS